MKKNLLTLVIAAVLVVIFALLLFTFQVRQSEVAVLTTFGKPAAANIDQPNLYFKWPWPIQQVYRFDQRVQNFEDKFSENLTADNTMLLTSVYVGWKISDAKEFFPKFAGGSVAAAQRQLEAMLRSAKAAVIGKHNLADFVNSNPQDLKLEAIESEIRTAVTTELATHNYGISIEYLGVKKLGLPESVTQTVFDRMKSERTKYISEAQFKGEAEANKIKSAAERQAADVLANAQAAATRIEGEGNAEAAKTLAVFQQNPELAIFQLQLEALKASLNQKSTLIFDERTPPFDLFQKLPANSK
ncbi:MAG: Modulator of FtsH protease HflC [Verrucomicrobiota bacterium]